jgi:ribonuclease HI
MMNDVGLKQRLGQQNKKKVRLGSMNNPIFDGSILVYTDGASKGNPGPGGWGAIIATPEGQVTELGAAHKEVTNNQMEMKGVIEALVYLRRHEGQVAILTDSTYLIQGITQWIWGWMRNGWQTAAGSEVINKAYWQRLHQLVQGRKEKNLGELSWHYVRGHSGIEGNERVDQIASDFASGKRVDLYNGPLQRYDYDLYNIPDDTSLPKRSNKSRNSKKAAYSYLSYVNGELQRHQTWAECEARVKGRSGAKFKKALSAADEAQIKKDWGLG